MNRGPLIFLGSFFGFAISWFWFVLAPHLQLDHKQPVVMERTGRLYPSAPSGQAQKGADIYRANGCYYCHTEQVRQDGFGADQKRGWGVRRSVAQDYIYDQPVMAGAQRIGPDLASYGLRYGFTNRNQILLHLYDARAVVPKSAMPSYKYLFDNRKIGHTPATDALISVGGWTPPAGREIVPKPDALALADYVLSLRQEGQLYETPPPRGTTNAPSAGTNQPAGGTNRTISAAAPAATNAPATNAISK